MRMCDVIIDTRKLSTIINDFFNVCALILVCFVSSLTGNSLLTSCDIIIFYDAFLQDFSSNATCSGE